MPSEIVVEDLKPDTNLDRKQTAAALTALGYRISPATLATKATRGGGPPFRLFGNKPIYRWGDALDWAQARTSKAVTSTSEIRSSFSPKITPTGAPTGVALISKPIIHG